MEFSWTLPDPAGAQQQPSGRTAAQRFAALIAGDADLAARLAMIEDGDAFVTHALGSARANDIPLPEDYLRMAVQPDPLGLARWSTPLLTASGLPPAAWLPVNVGSDGATTCVDWAWLGSEPLHGSFYEDAIRDASRLPFNRAFRFRTNLHDLAAQAEAADAVTPSGFIFHMSRCGSTLAAQMLAAVPDSIVISEAAPIDAVVQLAGGMPQDGAARALRAMILAFGRKRSGRERHYVVKLDFWHALALPLFQRAFPDVPWVFLYREPVEVLVSQMRQRGMQMVPQYLPPGIYGIADADASMDEDYCARVLSAVCRAVVERGNKNGLLLNYRQLPDAVYSVVLPRFNISCGDADLPSLRRAALRDAKAPGLPFTADAEAKQRAATGKVRQAAERHVGEIYGRLEALRTASQLNVA